MYDLLLGAATGSWSAAAALIGIAACAAWCVVKVTQVIKNP